MQLPSRSRLSACSCRCGLMLKDALSHETSTRVVAGEPLVGWKQVKQSNSDLQAQLTWTPAMLLRPDLEALLQDATDTRVGRASRMASSTSPLSPWLYLRIFAKQAPKVPVWTVLPSERVTSGKDWPEPSIWLLTCWSVFAGSCIFAANSLGSSTHTALPAAGSGPHRVFSPNVAPFEAVEPARVSGRFHAGHEAALTSRWLTRFLRLKMEAYVCGCADDILNPVEHDDAWSIWEGTLNGHQLHSVGSCFVGWVKHLRYQPGQLRASCERRRCCHSRFPYLET